MINVGVREAKTSLSKLLKRVMQGQEVLITNRGKPVGKIVPVPQDHLSLAERINKMEEQGLLAPVRKAKATRLPPPLPPENNLQHIQIRSAACSLCVNSFVSSQ